MLSKHGNIPTFLFPIDRADPETFLHSSDFLDLSEVNPTTGNDHKMYNGEAYEVHHLRNSLAWWSFNRGQTRPLAMQFWQHTNVLFFVHSLNQARGLKDTYSYLSNAANTMKKEKVLTPYYAVAGQEISTDDQRGATLIEYQKAMGSNIDWGNMRAGLFCLEIGRNSYGLEVGKDWISRTLLAFHQTIANIQPVAVILTTVDVDSTTVAAAMTAVDYGTPLIVLDPIAQQLEKPHSKWRRVLLSLANVVVDSEREIGVFLDSIVLKSTQAEAKLNN